MAVESAADRAAFVNPDEFGAAAVYAPQAGLAVPVSGIFDRPFAAIDMVSGDAGIASTDPTFLMRLDDLPAGAADGDTLTIAAVPWTVRGLEPDGRGMVLVQLEEV